MLAKNRAKFFNVRSNLNNIIENSNYHILLIELKDYDSLKD